jgi:hypothetical protein
VKAVETQAKDTRAKTEDYVSINDFSWEQGDGYVKVRVTSGINGIGSLPKEQINISFTNKSFDLKIHGLNGVNKR